MKICFFVSCLSILFANITLAQGENNIWPTKGNYGLNFNTAIEPSLYDSSACKKGGGGIAAVCDKTGALLFYSDGISVFDRTHVAMPNGSGLMIDSFFNSGVAIAKVKGDDSLYFLFYLSNNLKSLYNTLTYSIVNMKLNGGKGDIVFDKKNIFIDSGFGDKMIIAGACGRQWLLLHHWDSAKFYAYQLGVRASIATPVYSTFSKIPRKFFGLYKYGEMEISNDFKKIALANNDSLNVILFDFDNSSGKVSNRLILADSETNGARSVEFSPDGTKLYYAAPSLVTTSYKGVYQYDLSSGDTTIIKGSKVKIANEVVHDLRLGPDGMIYFRNATPPYGTYRYYDRIRNPNLAGVACNYQVDWLSVATTYSFDVAYLGSQFHPLIAPKDTFFSTTNFTLCQGAFKNLSPRGEEVSVWNDGDTIKTKTISSTPNVYWVESYTACSFFRDTFQIQELLPIYSFTKRDTTLCLGSMFTLNGRSGADSVIWYDGTNSITKTQVASVGKYWSKSHIACTIIIDTLEVSPLYTDTIFTTQKLEMCEGNTSYELNGRDAAQKYLWDNGNITKKNRVLGEGKYWVRSSLDCKLYIDTFDLRAVKYKPQNINTDTVACFQKSIKLLVQEGYTNYLWSNGSKAKDTLISNSGMVYYTAIDTSNCVMLHHEFRIHFLEFKQTFTDTTSCQIAPTILDAGLNVPYAQYVWSTGDTTATTLVNKSGLYTVIVSALGCKEQRDINFVQNSLKVFLGNPLSMCEGETLILQPNPKKAKYLWNTGDTASSIMVNKSGTYSVIVSENGCEGEDSTNVSFVNCTNCVVFPNSFSPNRDGRNDYFKPIVNCATKIFELQIYNRWGQQVFMGQNPNVGWDGTFGGQDLNPGNYFYLLKVAFSHQGSGPELFRGDIILLR